MAKFIVNIASIWIFPAQFRSQLINRIKILLLTFGNRKSSKLNRITFKQTLYCILCNCGIPCKYNSLDLGLCLSTVLFSIVNMYRIYHNKNPYITFTLVSGARSLKISPTFIFSGLVAKLLSRNTARRGLRRAISFMTVSGIFSLKQAMRSPSL